MRGEDDREAIVGHGGHERRHELVARERVEPGDGFVEHEELGALGKHGGQRHLGMLAARQLADLAIERDVELGHAPARPAFVPARG